MNIQKLNASTFMIKGQKNLSLEEINRRVLWAMATSSYVIFVKIGQKLLTTNGINHLTDDADSVFSAHLSTTLFSLAIVAALQKSSVDPDKFSGVKSRCRSGSDPQRIGHSVTGKSSGERQRTRLFWWCQRNVRSAIKWMLRIFGQ